MVPVDTDVMVDVLRQYLPGQLAADLGIPLCTSNQKHYAVIPKLRTVQPYRR